MCHYSTASARALILVGVFALIAFCCISLGLFPEGCVVVDFCVLVFTFFKNTVDFFKFLNLNRWGLLLSCGDAFSHGKRSFETLSCETTICIEYGRNFLPNEQFANLHTKVARAWSFAATSAFILSSFYRFYTFVNKCLCRASTCNAKMWKLNLCLIWT